MSRCIGDGGVLVLTLVLVLDEEKRGNGIVNADALRIESGWVCVPRRLWLRRRERMGVGMVVGMPKS
jgi:hypothetical protein